MVIYKYILILNTMMRAIKQEVKTLSEELYLVRGDLIRAYNKYIRKSKSLEVWVVFK